jgi:beta-xylosidase
MLKKTKLKKAARALRMLKISIPGIHRLFGVMAVSILAAYLAAAQNPTVQKAKLGDSGDEFNSEKLSSQWQWHGTFQDGWAYMFPARGALRMNSVQTPENFKNLRDLPNLLLQKFPAEEFTATAKIMLYPRFEGEKFGLLVMGDDYAYVAVSYKGGKIYIAQATAKDADKGFAETENVPYLLDEKTFYLRVKVEKSALWQFSYSTDGAKFTNLGVPFNAREASGAKIGLFFTRPGKFNDAGTADVDWFRFE